MTTYWQIDNIRLVFLFFFYYSIYFIITYFLVDWNGDQLFLISWAPTTFNLQDHTDAAMLNRHLSDINSISDEGVQPNEVKVTWNTDWIHYTYFADYSIVMDYFSNRFGQ